MLIAYVASAAYSAPVESFLFKMATIPDVKDLFLPFMQAT